MSNYKPLRIGTKSPRHCRASEENKRIRRVSVCVSARAPCRSESSGRARLQRARAVLGAEQWGLLALGLVEAARRFEANRRRVRGAEAHDGVLLVAKVGVDRKPPEDNAVLAEDVRERVRRAARDGLACFWEGSVLFEEPERRCFL